MMLVLFEHCDTMESKVFVVISFFISYIVAQGVINNTLLDIVCGEHQVFNSCGKCIKTCSDPNPTCKGACLAGCFCEDGFFMAPNSSCVSLQNCPQAEITFSSIELTIDECHSDEEFVWCGWCERSCSDPHPVCPNSTCTRGCQCRPPLLRHYSGHCVEETYCLPQKCSNNNEEYSCRYGCEVRCVPHACVRPRRCRLGCHCKRGLYRNAHGQCVTADKCFDVSKAVP